MNFRHNAEAGRERSERRWWFTMPCAEASCQGNRRAWHRVWHGCSGFSFRRLRYCSPQCLERALSRAIGVERAAAPVRPRTSHRIPLGLMLLSRGQLTNAQLRRALEQQSSAPKVQLGRWLQQLGFVEESQVTSALAAQWGCPVLLQVPRDLAHARLLPANLLQGLPMLPLQFVPATRTLYLGFSLALDYPAMYAIEQMLDCRTEACLIPDSQMRSALLTLAGRSSDFVFDGAKANSEIARIVSGYGLKLGAEEIRLVACGSYLWARVDRPGNSNDLLFARSGPAQESPAVFPLNHATLQRVAS